MRSRALLPPSPFLYPLTDPSTAGLSHAGLVGLLGAAGVRMVQVREKALGDAAWLDVARAAVAARAEGTLVVVNDRVDLALLAGAQGVHLGDQDLPPADARTLAGEDLILGTSTHSLEQALAACELPIDYLALGPIYPSGTKPGRAPLGPECLYQLRRRTAMPVVAIGGVSAGRVKEVVEAGADGVAVVGAVMVEGEVRSRAGEMLARVDEAGAARRGPTIFLVGFMGSGKSTVGPPLARALGLPFVDLDARVEAKAGKTVAAIWDERGEDGFRALESEALAELAGRRLVLATGGGVMSRPENLPILRKRGRVLWLRVPFEVIWARSVGDSRRVRPLWTDEGGLRALYERREGMYSLADRVVDLGTSSPEAAVRLVLDVARGLEDVS